MVLEEVLKERERIKKLIERVINATISWREKNIKRNKRFPSIFERLKERLLFLIDNPDYKRTGNIKSPDKYNTWENLEKGNIECTPPEPLDLSEPLLPEEPDSFDDEEEALNLEKHNLKLKNEGMF